MLFLPGIPGVFFFFLICCSSSKILFISHGMCASIVILSPVGYSTLSPLSYSLEPGNFSGRSLAGVWDRPWLWNASLTCYVVHSHPCPHSRTSSSSQLYSRSQSLTANKIMNENQLHEDAWAISDASLPCYSNFKYILPCPISMHTHKILISQTIATDNFT